MQDMIGRYRVLGRLGSGGYGEVLLAEGGDGRRVALKLFEPRDANLGSTEGAAAGENIETLRDRFVTEARILGTLAGHPHIVDILDFGETDDGAPFYVMPYLSAAFADELGRDVFDQQAVAELPEALRPRSVPVDRVLEIASQLIDALDAVHGAGLVHRDIKPANILFDEDGKAKLIDFGIAKLPDAAYSTALHVGLGHRNYMAPEQRECAKYVDARSDLYSLGVVMYRALTGKLPVGRYVDPRDAVAGVDRALNDLVLQLLAEDRSERPQDIAAVKRLFPSIAPRSKPRINLVDITQITRRATAVAEALAPEVEAGAQDVEPAAAAAAPTVESSTGHDAPAPAIIPSATASADVGESLPTDPESQDAHGAIAASQASEPANESTGSDEGASGAKGAAEVSSTEPLGGSDPADDSPLPEVVLQVEQDANATFQMPLPTNEVDEAVEVSSGGGESSPAGLSATPDEHFEAYVESTPAVDEVPVAASKTPESGGSIESDDEGQASGAGAEDPRYVALNSRIDALLDQWGVLGKAERMGLRPLLAVAGVPDRQLDALITARQRADPRREGKRNLVELIQSDLQSLSGTVPDAMFDGYLAAASAVGWSRDDLERVLARGRAPTHAKEPPAEPSTRPEPFLSSMPPAAKQRSARWPWAVAAMVVVGLLSAGWMWKSGPEAPDPGQVAWKEASAAGTVAAFEGFLAAWPERPEAQEAKQRVQALKASAQEDAAQAEAGLIAETQSLLRQLGREIEVTGQIDEPTRAALDAVAAEQGLAWSEPLQPTLVDALRVAASEADRQAWEAALKTNSVRALEGYAQRFPEGVGQAELATRLEEARSQQAARARLAEIQRKAEEERLAAEAQAKAEEERRVAEAAAAEAARVAAEEALRRNAGFEEAGEGLLRDTTTGLVWTRRDNGTGVSRRKAGDYCSARNMRLPSTQELIAIHARSGAGTTTCGNQTCRVSPLFVLSGDEYWSDRKRPDSDGRGVNLATGAKLRVNIPLIDSVRVLCVRS